MRVQSNYGDTVFDTSSEFLITHKKMRKLLVYLVLTSFSIYVGKVVLNINLAVLDDILYKILNGESISYDSSYILEIAKGNEFVAYIFSVYYFLEKSFFVLKDFAYLVVKKLFDIALSIFSIIK